MKIYFSLGKSQKGNAFVGLILIAGILVFGIWYLRSVGSPLNKKVEVTIKNENIKISAGKAYIIEITDRGFLPEHVTLRPYDKLTFINKDLKTHQPVSSDCPELDSKKELIQNDSFSAVFTSTDVCDFSDKMNPSFEGVVTVSE